MTPEVDTVKRSAGAAATTDALYLGTAPDATFATVHLPTSGVGSGRGVILCPPLAWDDLCTYRARRSWAEAIAQAGHAAVRLDLPGVGDSGGSPRSPGRLGAWKDAVTTAAVWLRDEAGCTRVAALGIGFGGMLAWLAAADGAPIDDLALWAVPLRGRQLVRELRGAALISIDRRVLLDGSDEGSEPGKAEELMDEAGQVITSETLAALSAIDLRTLDLPQAERRQLLVFQRSGNPADAALSARVSELGADVTTAPGDEFEAMMRYVQTSVIPATAIESSLRWLAAPVAPGAALNLAGTGWLSRPQVSGSIEFEFGGVRIRERLTELRAGDALLNGVIAEPVGTSSIGLTAVFFGGGSDRRIGPNRMWVDVSRRWAARGVTAVRMDPAGIGDSPGDEHQWDELVSHYRPANRERTLELLRELERLGLPNRFVLTGFCSGAFRSLNAALCDERIVGVFAMSLPFFRWTWWTTTVRDTWLVTWKPRPGVGPAKIALGLILQRAAGVTHAIQHRLVALGQYRRSRADRVLEKLDQQGTELLLLIKDSSYAYEQLSRPRRMARIARLRHVQVHAVPSRDVRFRPLRVQEWINDALDGALGRVLETYAPSFPLQPLDGAASASDAIRPTEERALAVTAEERALAVTADRGSLSEF